jgi:hypothetical protein
LKERSKCPLGRAAACRTVPPGVGIVGRQAVLSKMVEEGYVCYSMYPVDFHAWEWLNFPWSEVLKTGSVLFQRSHTKLWYKGFFHPFLLSLSVEYAPPAIRFFQKQNVG